MKVGDVEYFIVNDGTFKLDGGAMFGVVPKPVWQKFFTPDDQNRITLGTNTLVIKRKNRIALVDLGMGEKFDSKLLAIYDIRRRGTLIDNLAGIGINREDVTDVIFTHGHLDHTGWATMVNNGSIIPTFARAKYHIQIDTIDEIKNPNEKTKPNYNYLNFQNLDNLIEEINGDEEIFDGLELIKTGGHTKGHQIVVSREGSHSVIYFGDLIPTSAHIKPAYIMAYDLYPMETFSKKKELLEKAYEDKSVIVFEHDPNVPVAVLENVEKYKLSQVNL